MLAPVVDTYHTIRYGTAEERGNLADATAKFSFTWAAAGVLGRGPRPPLNPSEGRGFEVILAEQNAAKMAAARAAGQGGEEAAGAAGPKRGVRGPISGKMRYPDKFGDGLLRESKNVARQGWTAQLKDYSAIARNATAKYVDSSPVWNCLLCRGDDGT